LCREKAAVGTFKIKMQAIFQEYFSDLGKDFEGDEVIVGANVRVRKINQKVR
jgi:hypothetical protein